MHGKHLRHRDTPAHRFAPLKNPSLRAGSIVSMPLVELARTVRFSVNPAAAGVTHACETSRNTYAGSPAMHGLGAFYEMTVRCQGAPDAITSYLLSVSQIDRVVRDRAIPVIEDAMRTRPATDPADLLPELVAALRLDLDQRLACVEWRLTPFYAVSMSAAEPHRVTITDRFEFAAAHRLHVDQLSDNENRSVFGRCNNPSGHGHNYRLEVAVSTEIPRDGTPRRFSLPAMQAIVAERVLDRFDHKHLNLDTSEFAARNPTVENLAETCFQLLDSPIEDAGARLERVTVWETEKTSCSYARQP
jgi:6-pyruvoyltetrahydropterin/6-carboxytetrahydropterin synthase